MSKVRYHLHIKVKAHVLAPSVEMAQVVECANPIEYDSDIAALSQTVARALGVDEVQLLSWRPLKGEKRP